MGMPSRIFSGAGVVCVLAVAVVVVSAGAVAGGQGGGETSGLGPDGQPLRLRSGQAWAAVPTLSQQQAAAPSASRSTKDATPRATGPHFGAVDGVIEEAIRDRTIPGAVLIVGHDGKVIYRKAYGARALEPRRELMTLDTIFDVASLTKVIATTTAVMQLVEKGKVRLNDPVAKYLPEFAQNGKEEITVRQLLTHYSGIEPDLDLKAAWTGKQTAYGMANGQTPDDPPGSKFSYSDVNFIVLGELIERVSGETLDEYAARHIFTPLKMLHTRYLPPLARKAGWIEKIAPTQYDENEHMLRGVVHDPSARRMGGSGGACGIIFYGRRSGEVCAERKRRDHSAAVADALLGD